MDDGNTDNSNTATRIALGTITALLAGATVATGGSLVAAVVVGCALGLSVGAHCA